VVRLWNREFAEPHFTTPDCPNNMLCYLGVVLKDMAIKVLRDNELSRGRIMVGDRVAARPGYR
jgi:hypothetical protein